MCKKGKSAEMGRPHIFLDFDGVICDSIDETYVSSWLAYSESREREAGSILLSDYISFKSYRPFIRGGADYMLIQRCIDAEHRISTQEEFDAQAEIVGEGGMDEFHRQFYSARSRLLETDRAYWLKLNRIYPGVSQALKAVTAQAWILTTKEASFAHEIITSKGFDWGLDRIICSGKERKVEIIEKILGENDTAVFIDDQIDHFSDPVDPRISCYLAGWGYVRPEWLNGETEVLTEEGFSKLIQDSLGGL
jgi:hypothetical protein